MGGHFRKNQKLFVPRIPLHSVNISECTGKRGIHSDTCRKIDICVWHSQHGGSIHSDRGAWTARASVVLKTRKQQSAARSAARTVARTAARTAAHSAARTVNPFPTALHTALPAPQLAAPQLAAPPLTALPVPAALPKRCPQGSRYYCCHRCRHRRRRARRSRRGPAREGGPTGLY